MSTHSPILPGSTLGVLGGGQLGRMLAIAARQMGYRVHTYAPDTDTPAGQVADVETRGEYHDLNRVRDWARNVDAATFEFENVPAETADTVAQFVPVRPGGGVLHVCQHRRREKEWLSAHGFPCAPWRDVRSHPQLTAALQEIGCPAILKTAGFGYDGKGQFSVHAPDDAGTAWDALGPDECVLEGRVAFQCELSVVGARGVDGQVSVFAPAENAHVGGILDVSVCPARISPQTIADAQALTISILEQLNVVGVLCAELFLTHEGKLLVNELAPRPHNSGHLTVDACRTSQFAQQVRAVCALPLGVPDLLTGGAAMANLLGDLWDGGVPRWPAALGFPGVSLHLYGKEDARPGRKMGHLTATAGTPQEAEALVRAARESLKAAP